MRTLATMRELDVWYAHTVVDDAVEAEVDHTYAQTIRRTAAKAHTRDNLEALSKLTRVVDGRRRLANDPPLLIPIDELVGDAQARRYEQQMSVLIDEYQQSLDPSRRWLMRPIPLRRRCPQGGRRGQRRHPSVGGTAVGAR